MGDMVYHPGKNIFSYDLKAGLFLPFLLKRIHKFDYVQLKKTLDANIVWNETRAQY